MKQKIIIHNSITLDGSLTGFMPDMELHYRIAGSYKPDAHLIGSETILKGIELFEEEVPDELPEDFKVPQNKTEAPWWVIVDSGGRLKGVLHTCRRFVYCRDVIILVSETTPPDYIKHLEERNYKYIVAGMEKADLKIAAEKLQDQLGIINILTDTGMILSNLLLNMGMISEISLLVHPLIAGEKCYPVFANLKGNLHLKLKKTEQYENGCLWMVYTIDQQEK